MKKDRVETSSVEIFEAFQAAETLNNETGRPLKVVGWYHSHPHITVQPSNIGQFECLFVQMYFSLVLVF